MIAAALQLQLQEEYCRETWQTLLPQLLPGVELFAHAHDFPLTGEREQAIATARRQFGVATLADGKRIAFYEIEVAPGIQLLSNRVGLRNLIARCIDEVSAHAVLAFFVQPGLNSYRLTYAAKESTLNVATLAVETRETATRRFTYILGPGESCRTAADRLAGLPASAKLSDLTDAFSVEKLNKEFFADFCRSFDRVSKDIRQHHAKWSDADVEREAQTILDRLVFLYFVQRKGWLNRQRDYLFRHFREQHAGKAGQTYFQQFLRPLFVKLSTEGSQADIPGHDLPFLNGGLFNDEYGDDQSDEAARRRTEVRVGNDTLQFVFENLLERYNFTIHEDSPTNQEVAIDPEMLGKIFEALVLQIEQSTTGGKSLRHDTGSHYTPRPIVHYLCVAALAGWLENQPLFAGKANARERIGKLLALDASEGLNDDERATLNDCLTPDDAAILLDRLATLRACDPAVGSGAFPMGLLRELLNLARLCETRARGQDPVDGDRTWLYEAKKRIIERAIYGVDLQERAIEICKLRLWLSLMVDNDLGVDPLKCDARSFRKALADLEPLPNLDFKIRRADSLVDKIHGEPIPLGKIHVGSQAHQALNELTAAKRDFYGAERAAEKRRLRLAIYKATADLAQIELTAARNEFGLIPDPANAARVADLDRGQREVGQVLVRLRAVAKLQKAKRITVADIEQALADVSDFFDNPAKPTFVWHLDFAEVFFRSEQPRASEHGGLPLATPDGSLERGSLDGFDIVLANPPYVRQELLTAYKPWLEAHYATFHGMADLYVYFYELGVRVLKPGGLLSFIVTNKWMKAGYGEPLRRFFSEKAWVRSVVDFGHAKQIFQEADVFPSIIVVQKPTDAPKPKTARLCIIPREQLRIDDLSLQVEKEGAELDISKLGAEAWSLESKSVDSLLTRIRKGRRTLKEVTGIGPLYGIKTGLNEAFLIDDDRRRKLIAEHDGCREVIKPFLRGSDVGRWGLDWAKLWMIALPSSNDRAWPWAELGDAAEAEFKARYPSLHGHFKPLEKLLRKRQDQGKYWWELRPCAYWEAFSKEKLFYQVIQYHPRYAFDASGLLGNDKTYFLPTADLFLLAVLNSPLMWWHNWRMFTHLKDEALSPMAYMVETLPIAEPTAAIRQIAEKAVRRLIEITSRQQETQRKLLDWLRVEYAIEKPGNKLQSAFELDSDTLVSEVKRIRGRELPLTPAGVQGLRDEYTRTLKPARDLAAETLKLECALSALVNQAYGLTPKEIDLMWKTAPPRMPIPPPNT